MRFIINIIIIRDASRIILVSFLPHISWAVQKPCGRDSVLVQTGKQSAFPALHVEIGYVLIQSVKYMYMF